MSRPHYTAYLEGSLRLSATGEWWHEGVPFTHPELIRLFHRSIVWDDASASYLIRIGNAAAYFTCEDTAFFVASIQTAHVPWEVTLYDETIEPLDPATLSIGADNQVYCRVKGGHPARFCRAAHQDLLAYTRDETTLLIGGVPISVPRRS